MNSFCLFFNFVVHLHLLLLPSKHNYKLAGFDKLNTNRTGKFWHLFGYQLCVIRLVIAWITKYYTMFLHVFRRESECWLADAPRETRPGP